MVGGSMHTNRNNVWRRPPRSIATMKSWLVMGLLVFGVFQTVPKKTDKTTANQDAGKPATNQPHKSDGMIANPPTEQNPERKQGSADPETHNCWDWLSSPNASNWALVIIGTVGIIVAIRTLKIIERQTSATEIAANATEASVEAFLAENRPWVLVEVGSSGLRIQQLLAGSADESAHRTAISRAYYSAYHAVNDHLKANNVVTDPQRASHERVWSVYIKSSQPACKQIGNVGFRLRNARVEADYKADKTPSPALLQWSLQDAQSIIATAPQHVLKALFHRPQTH